MPGALLRPSVSSGLPASPTLSLTDLDRAIAALPGLRFDFDPDPAWYGQHGPAGYGWYSKHGRDERIDAMIPIRATRAPALTAAQIGSRAALVGDGVDDCLVPFNGPFATASYDGANLNDMAVNLTEWSFITVVKTTLNVSSYIVGPMFKPSAVLTSGAGGGECLSILLTPLNSGAQQYPRLLYGNNAARLGSLSFTFTTAASLMVTCHPSRGIALYIDNVEVDSDPADTAALVTGRFQIGRRINSNTNIMSHKQGRMIITDVALDDGADAAYVAQRDAMMALLHAHYSPDLPAL